MKKYQDDLDRTPVVDKYADKEERHMPKPFNQRQDGKMRLLHTLDSMVEQERTFPDKPKGDRYSHIKKFLKKQK